MEKITGKKKGWLFYAAVALKSLYLYAAGIVSLLMIAVILLFLQQGIDVVMQVGEYSGPFFYSWVAIVLWSLLNWYTARIVGYAKAYRDSEIPWYFHRHIPRLIAFNCFVVVQAAIFSLHSLQTGLVSEAWPAGWSGWYFVGLALFVLFHNLLYVLFILLWERATGKQRKQRVRLSVALLCLVYLVGIGAVLYAHRGYADWERHVFRLPWFALLLFASELLFLRFLVLRRRMIDQKDKDGITVNRASSTFLLDKLSINPKYKEGEERTLYWVAVIANLALLLLIAAISKLSLATRFGPLAMLLLSLGVLIYLINLVNYFSIRVGFNLHIVLFTWAIILGFFDNPYTVQTHPTADNKPFFASRMTVKEHLLHWLKDRQSQLKDSGQGPYEVYVVLSNGGGSLSGNWVSSILTKLQDRSREKDSTNSFSDHVICIAGASGGTIGNIVFYSLLREQKTNPIVRRDVLYPHARAFFKGDFLSYTLGHLFGTDFFRHILPLIRGTDRARALELSMTGSKDDSLTSYLLGLPVEKIFDDVGTMPALYINTTRVDNGMPGELSSIRLPDSSQRIDVGSLLDSSSNKTRNRSNSVELVTAGVLSSRFPYVSPAGRIKDQYFVDGGYFDNSGAGIVLEYLRNIEAVLKYSSDELIRACKNKLHFNVMQITNGLTKESNEKPKIHPLKNDLFAPIITLMGIQGSSTKIEDGMLRAYLNQLNGDTAPTAYHTINLFKENETERTFPVSWVLSDYNLHRMGERADERVDSMYKSLRLDYRHKH